MSSRTFERFDVAQKTSFDFFTQSTGRKKGLVGNVSRGGCLLKTNEQIDNRRWLRLVLQDPETNLAFTGVGRVIRREYKLEVTAKELTLYRYGIEFTFPNALSDQDLDLILALSNKNLSVRSCLMRNNISSLRSEFLA